jgi:hypothetical protein
MLGFVKSMMSLGDDAEVGNIVKQIGDFYGYIMGEMKAEIPSGSLDILIMLTLASERLAQQGEEPTGHLLIEECDKILQEYVQKHGDEMGRVSGKPALPPRQVFVHGIDMSVSVSSEMIVKFLVGFWRLPHCISLYVIHVLDVRLGQLQMQLVPPDEQRVLGAFQTALDNQRSTQQRLEGANIKNSGGWGRSVDTVYVDPLRPNWPSLPRALDRFPEPSGLKEPPPVIGSQPGRTKKPKLAGGNARSS